MKERVLTELTNRDGLTSVRKLASEFDISQTTVFKILHEKKLKPYKFKVIMNEFRSHVLIYIIYSRFVKN